MPAAGSHGGEWPARAVSFGLCSLGKVVPSKIPQFRTGGKGQSPIDAGVGSGSWNNLCLFSD
jgi:hypothetical protein